MDWINLTKTSRKALIIIMLRASKPIRITAGRIIPMDIKSFLHVSYINNKIIYAFFFKA